MRFPGFSAEASCQRMFKFAGSWVLVDARTGSVQPAFKGCTPCRPDADSPLGGSQYCCYPNSNEPGGENCLTRNCRPPPPPQPPPPPEDCTVYDNRRCLPWPFNSICWGECQRVCCRMVSNDQRQCSVSDC